MLVTSPNTGKIEIDRAFIVGAGFSSYANVPLQSGFTEALLEGARFTSAHSPLVVRSLKEFVNEIFNPGSDDPELWPELEDLYTIIDLSANSGHHLGKTFSPARLRTTRRSLIFRTIRMLSQRYSKADREAKQWKALSTFMAKVNLGSSAFVSMNWDTIIEQQIAHGDEVNVDYGCNALAASLTGSGPRISPRALSPRATKALIIKMHGSTNWLYCDNCRRLFWFPPGEENRVARQLLGQKDWERIAPNDNERSGYRRKKCDQCQGVYLGTRIATFSYRKALDFSMFQKSWFSAERVLRDAATWIFIGYSLPGADFEFKHLLKRVQLSRKIPPSIFLVTGGGMKAARATERNYQRFFGKAVVPDRTFLRGLSAKAIAAITQS